MDTVLPVRDGEESPGETSEKISSLPLTDPHRVIFFWNGSPRLVTVVWTEAGRGEGREGHPTVDFYTDGSPLVSVLIPLRCSP